MKLTVIVPSYNEAKTLPRILRRILDVPLEIDKEVLVVDDGSEDSTQAVLEPMNHPAVKVLMHRRNRGKGAAVRTALCEATGDIILIQDADLEYDPAFYPDLIKPILEGRADVVYGSRILGGSARSYRRYYWGGRFLSFLANLLWGTRITDESTGYKVMRTRLMKELQLECNGFDFCPEVTAKLGKKGIPIYEVPINYRPRSFAEGKKIRWKDGWVAVKRLIQYRFGGKPGGRR